MKTTRIISWFLLLPLMTSCYAEDVRQPAVAGAFYPAQPEELAKMIDGFLAQANPPAIPGEIRALVVPHAGYIYSAPVAAVAYKAIEGKPFKTVVLIGNSHREGYDGASVYNHGKFRTPLGDAEIDSELADRLIAANPKMFYRESPHIPEHSLEVQVPFLQKVLGRFKLVPILLGTVSREAADILGDALAANAGPDVLVMASTDMSHYPPYDHANFADRKVADAIVSGSEDNLERTIRQLESMGVPKAATFLCGEGATKAVMRYAEKVGAKNAQLLKYANSGDTAGSKDGVVGYCAVAFSIEGGTNMPAKQNKDEEVVNKAEQEELLKLAKLTVESVVKTGRKPDYANKMPGLERPLGAFVTLHKNGQLRGCIGRFEPDIPIYEVVMEMAVAAATQDYRFSPVSEKELDRIDYEISVLSPLRKVASWKEIEIGKHGVEVARGMRRGVFLPQVATETGWDLETFMNTLCEQKAGLPADAWKDPKTDIFVFTAQVFGAE
jgi:AmmeMemoRadiSam system protein B/AmmeMemoRadiSam system protein A